jgi:predicted RNA methylase
MGPPLDIENASQSGRNSSSSDLADALPASAANLIMAALRTNQHALGRLSAMPGSLDWASETDELISRVGRHTIPRWHFPMLNDRDRNEAFVTAIERQVVPGSHVLDIGSGTGLLAMIAARAGAGRVTTCEANPLLAEIARQVIAVNDLSDVITVVPKMSTELRVGRNLPRRADLIVSEIVDCGLIGEGLLPTMRHARTHLLAPGGTLLPKSARLFGFLVESDTVNGLNRVTTAAGFDLRLLNMVATRGHFPVRLQTWPHEVLSSTVELASFDLTADPLDDGQRRIALPVVTTGIAHALAVWFEMDIGSGVTLRTPPDGESHWMQALVPLPTPRPIAAGDEITIDFEWRDQRLFIR